ncbi:unnamed protein product, partial [Didymodactylos carnosus]
AIKDALNTLNPAVQTALIHKEQQVKHFPEQTNKINILIEELCSEYEKLQINYKNKYSELIKETRQYKEYKYFIEHLSKWLTSTNENINELLKTNLDELTKYKSLLERATLLNRDMLLSLPNGDHADQMKNEIELVKEQWQSLIDSLNMLKEKHASRISSPDPTSMSTSKINDDNDDSRSKLSNDHFKTLEDNIQCWIALTKQILNQKCSVFDETSSENLIYQLKDCEKELNRLKIHIMNLMDDKNNVQERIKFFMDELNTLEEQVKTERLKLENRVEQYRCFWDELTSLNDWLIRFNNNNNVDARTVELALTQRQQHFQDVILEYKHLKANYNDENGKINIPDTLQMKIDSVLNMWEQLSTRCFKDKGEKIGDEQQLSSTLLANDSEFNQLLTEGELLLEKNVYILDKNDILLLKTSIDNYLNEFEKKYEALSGMLHVICSSPKEQQSIGFTSKAFNTETSSNTIRNALLQRQRTLSEMLIDTDSIEKLRVNFVAHFSDNENYFDDKLIPVNDKTEAHDALIEKCHQTLKKYEHTQDKTNKIHTLIEWVEKKQEEEKLKSSNTNNPDLSENTELENIKAPIATLDLSKSLDDFADYIQEIEANVATLKREAMRATHDPSTEQTYQTVLKQINEPPQISSYSQQLEQRANELHQRWNQIQVEMKELKLLITDPKSVNDLIENVDSLVKNLREKEEQIRINNNQIIDDYTQIPNFINDCKRIITELEQQRSVVERIINTGKQMYQDKDVSSGTESADDTYVVKKHSDLTLRKVRRNVVQLSQRWKNANSQIKDRLKHLQRAQTNIDGLFRKCDYLNNQLNTYDLQKLQQPEVRSLTAELTPLEIEQSKLLLANLMSCKADIDTVNQIVRNIDSDYNISPSVQQTGRIQDINNRWNYLISSVTQRVQLLQDSLRYSSESDRESSAYSHSVEPPWQRSTASNKVPYYINHSDRSTSWDHPKMLDLMRSFSNLNDIKFSAYRTAMKLRTLQKRLCLDLTPLGNIISVFEQQPTLDSVISLSNYDNHIDVAKILHYLQNIFEKTSIEYPQLLNVTLTVDLTLNWLLNVYDTSRTGTIRLLSIKIALALLCRGNIEEKYRYIFSLAASEGEAKDMVNRKNLSILFHEAIMIPKQLGEVAAFGGSSVEPSVKSCFEYANNPDAISATDFLEWVKLEPQSLVWLPVMHRLAASENAKHEARCNICKEYPLIGFRYRSLKHFNCDICQNCFFSGKQTKFYKLDDPLQEYYTTTTASEDIRDFFRIFKNKLWSKHRKQPKLGYLPLPLSFDETNDSIVAAATVTTSNQNSTNIVNYSPTPATRAYTQQSVVESDDEHSIIAQHCRNLNNFIQSSPRLPTASMSSTELLTRSSSLDNEQRHELEAIITDLEDENRLLQNEYNRLCKQHIEKSQLINEHEHSSNEQIMSYNDLEMLREAKLLRHHKCKLEARMKILEDHNKQLELQLRKSKQLLRQPNTRSPALSHQSVRQMSLGHMSVGGESSSPIHTSGTSLRRSVERSLERQPNLITIDNLFSMADDINRAVVDLVQIITDHNGQPTQQPSQQHHRRQPTSDNELKT